MFRLTGGGGGAGDRGQSAPQRLLTGKFLLTQERGKEKGKKGKGMKIDKKRRKIVIKKENCYKKRWGPFFFFFFFLLFTFENDGNLFWVYQNGNFLSGKSISRREKNQAKWLCLLRKICLLRPCSPAQWIVWKIPIVCLYIKDGPWGTHAWPWKIHGPFQVCAKCPSMDSCPNLMHAGFC